MLATLGFLITAVLLFVFAYKFDELVRREDKELRLFGLAYALIGVAFLMWALLSLVSAFSILAGSVLVGDALLFAGSICAVLVFTPAKKRTLVAAGLGVLAIALLVFRAKQYYPAPSLQDGILFFNTQRPVAVLISVIVVVTWLPACMKVAKIISVKRGLARFYPLFMSAYILTVITATLFIQSRRREVIIKSFVGFSFATLLMVISNIVAKNSTGRRVSHEAK